MAKIEVIGLVLVEFQPGGKRYLFEAPSSVCIEVGSIVEVEDGDKLATVIASDSYINVTAFPEKFDLIVKAAEATLPLKRIKAIYSRRETEYEEDEE
jgi:hypothetical protein